MSKQKRKNSTVLRLPDGFFMLIVTVLVMSGLLMLFSASAPKAYSEGDPTGMAYVIKQAQFAVLGFIFMFGFAFFPKTLNVLRNKFFIIFFYLVMLTMLILVMFSPLGITHKGATRWINLGFIEFQPSELTKLFVPLALARFFQDHHSDIRNVKFYDLSVANKSSIIIQKLRFKFTAPFFILYKFVYLPLSKYFRYIAFPFLIGALPLAFIVPQTHLSASIIIVAIMGVTILVGDMKIKHIVPFILVILGVGALFIWLLRDSASAHVFERIEQMFGGTDDAEGLDWQRNNSLIAIGSGGLTGLGFTHSRQKYLFLPEPHNDYIFSIVCEELGYIGAMFVIFLFIGLIYSGFSIAGKAKDKFSMLLCTGIITQIGVQFLVNIIVVTGIVSTGISLPFFSYGGTALVVQLAEMGIVLNISRHCIE